MEKLKSFFFSLDLGTWPIRETFVAEMRKNYSEYGLQFSIGGQISIDVFPIGWDKTFCIQHLDLSKYQNDPLLWWNKTTKG